MVFELFLDNMRDEEEKFGEKKFKSEEQKIEFPLTIKRHRRLRFTLSRSDVQGFKLSIGKTVLIIIMACILAVVLGYVYAMFAFR